ncbi:MULTISPECIES: hypothetical protein [Chitinophaga]|uniref:hypothetical protein n=1 Tax=Chitinophaga TaxID=79328 RepID=UPI001ADD0365|nr:hypothetical protein [Chitinophaga chungangae]
MVKIKLAMVQNNGKSGSNGQAHGCIWDKWPEKQDEGRWQASMSGTGRRRGNSAV